MIMNTAHLISCIILILCTFSLEYCYPDQFSTLWPSNSLTKVLRSAKPDPEKGVLEASGAKGEIVSTQAVFRSTTDVASVKAKISNLVHGPSGTAIPAESVKLQWVRYIDITKNTEGVPADELIAIAPVSIPDPYWADAAIKIEANQAQPLWIEIHVPPTAEAGDYSGKLAVTDGKTETTLPVKLHVWNFEVPRQRHLSVINWWNFPGLGFNHWVKPYTEEYWKLLEESCAFLVEHRQTDVNVPVNIIEETGDDKIGYKHDTGKIEHYAEIAFKAGIQRIHFHSLARMTGNRHLGNTRIVLIESNLRRLTAFEQVIQKRNWKDRFLVSIRDEPFIYQEESYKKTVEIAHKKIPSIKIIEAVQTPYLGNLDIYVPTMHLLHMWEPHFKHVRRNGGELWYYTCNEPRGRYPNRFIDQSMLKVRVLHWINYLYDLDGFLHWGLNQFEGNDPYSERGVGGRWPPGDRAIAYPWGKKFIGSLRFSAQRDGLEDYEYLWVLENELRRIKERLGEQAFWLNPRQRSLEFCKRVVRSLHQYTRDDQVMLNTRQAIAEEIESLQITPLLLVQTSPLEGTSIPYGRRYVNIRGLTTPGATVFIDNQRLDHTRRNGYFDYIKILGDNQSTITIQAGYQGNLRTITRTFKLIE